ncbi:DJ-1/PfpI family protein [Rhodococcus rhodochrous]|uniref:DJ-1/PfpI family protein n=1 Tax=Rhodococcus rhodochrous TaxID=1829 RepID=UPI0023F669BD
MQIAIVVFPGLTALDVVGPYEVLRYLPDADVRFVWHETGPVVTDSGMLALGATHTLDETPSPDIVLVPGSGTAIAVAAEDKRLREWLRSAHRTSTWTVSVCGGALVLAAAGLLEGRRAASHWQALTPLRAFGAVPCGDERVVFDGKLATCAGVSAGIDLALSLAARIAGEERAKAIQLMIEYDPDPPFDSGHTSSASRHTKVLANALLTRDAVGVSHMTAASRLAWSTVIDRVRARRSRTRAR